MTKNEEILAEFKKTGAPELLPLLALGQVTVMPEDSGRGVNGVLSAALVNASEETAWRVLLDYKNYCRFLSGITGSDIVSKKDNVYTVRFSAGLKVMGIGGSVKYTYRITVNRPYADVWDNDRKCASGYWAILPTDDKTRVVIVHADAAKNLEEHHAFFRFLVDRLPTAEVGLHISPVAMLVNRMRHQMEHAEARGK